MNDFPNRLSPILRSHLVQTPVLWICRTFVWVWDLLYFPLIDNCSSNSFPWKPMIPLLQHKHSPNHRMFFSISCNIRNYFLSFSHSIIHPIHEWYWFYRQFQFCFIVSDELLRPCLFLRIDIRSSRSVTRCYLIHNGLRGSVVKSFLVKETRSNFSYSFIRSSRSLVCLNLSFPLLTRPSTVVIPLLNNLLKRSFPWIAHGNDGRMLRINLCVYQDVPIFPLSQQLHSRDFDFHNFSSPDLLMSRMIRSTASLQ